MSPWENLIRPELGGFLLAVCRITGMMVTSPIPFEAAPRQVRVGAVILLSFLAHGAAPATASLMDPLAAVPLIFSELIIGISIGFVVRLAIAVAEVVGTSLAPMIGFGAAQVFDPGTGQQDSVLTRVFRLLAGLVALSVGLHRVMLLSLLRTFRDVPVGSSISMPSTARIFMRLTAEVINSGVRIALPIIAVLLMVQVALGFIARAAPAMQIFNIGFTVFLATGGLLLWLVMPDVARELAVLYSGVAEQIEGVLLALTEL